MIARCFKYPFQGDGDKKRLALGGLLFLGSALVFPMILLYGYLTRVVRHVVLEEPEMPEFDNWGGMFVTGIQALVVLVAYPLVAAVAIGLVGALWWFGLAPDVLLLVTLIFAPTVAAYFGPAAFINFATVGELSAAFDFGTIRDGATTSTYFVGWISGLLISSVGVSLASMLSIVLIGIPLMFYMFIVGWSVIARGYALSHWEGPAAGTPRNEVSASI